ncbi:MAG: alpha/beta hydrolase [Sphingorhabdus sp.]
MMFRQLIAAAFVAATTLPVPAIAAEGDDCAAIGTAQQDERLLEGKRFTVRVTGKEGGRDVVLIPGLSTPRDVWDDTVEQLAGCYRLHVVQLAGFGDEARENVEGPVIDPFLAQLASYIEHVIIGKDGGKKPMVIGHSFGGLTAMRLALKHPALIESAMVVDSLPFFGAFYGPAVTAENIEPQAAAIRKMILSGPAKRPNDGTLQAMSITDAGREKVAAWALTADPKVMGQVFYEVMTTDIRPALPGNTVPITMLYPIDQNGAFPAAAIEAVYTGSFAKAKNVRLMRIDDSRHFIMLDQPDEFLGAVKAFLAAE